MILVPLPYGTLEVQPTGKEVQVRSIPDGGLFVHDGQVWEKMGQSNACLSDLDDHSEVLPDTIVQEALHIKTIPRQYNPKP